jgi:hypothetical protein
MAESFSRLMAADARSRRETTDLLGELRARLGGIEARAMLLLFHGYSE